MRQVRFRKNEILKKKGLFSMIYFHVKRVIGKFSLFIWRIRGFSFPISTNLWRSSCVTTTAIINQYRHAFWQSVKRNSSDSVNGAVLWLTLSWSISIVIFNDREIKKVRTFSQLLILWVAAEQWDELCVDLNCYSSVCSL